MSNSANVTLHIIQPKTSRIGHTALLCVLWALTGLCIALVAARLTIHIRFRRRLIVDDALVILALCILISNSVVTTLMAPPMYDILKLSHGLLVPGPDFMERSSFYLKCQFASTVLFWSCLWTVKGCFLAFFWSLSSQTKWPRRFWWFVMVVTLLTYIGCIITYPLSCTSFVLGQCETPTNIYLSAVSLRFSTAVDMITDLLIIVLPLWLTLGLKMNFAQKVGLIGVLCLGVVTMAFAAIRVIVTSGPGGIHPEISWLALWSGIESSVAVSVACMTSFRVLFTQLRNSSSLRNQNPAVGRVYPTYGGGTGTIGSAKISNAGKKTWHASAHEIDANQDTDVELEKFAQPHGVRTTCIGADEPRAASSASDRDWPDTASQEHILPYESIRVQTTWRVTDG